MHATVHVSLCTWEYWLPCTGVMVVLTITNNNNTISGNPSNLLLSNTGPRKYPEVQPSSFPLFHCFSMEWVICWWFGGWVTPIRLLWGLAWGSRAKGLCWALRSEACSEYPPQGTQASLGLSCSQGTTGPSSLLNVPLPSYSAIQFSSASSRTDPTVLWEAFVGMLLLIDLLWALRHLETTRN